ncbi:MAG: hypothetical protein LBK67_04495 [Coriobacteriales bacterium]|jgi:hypothetical protein|nr:hypothetical protein [Coriobacteriales bacterium]
MDQIFVHSHARKHGITKDQIIHAWTNAIEVARREGKDGSIDYVAIGFDQNGKAIEMTAARNAVGFLVYHANTPPTARALRELGLSGGSHGR